MTSPGQEPDKKPTRAQPTPEAQKAASSCGTSSNAAAILFTSDTFFLYAARKYPECSVESTREAFDKVVSPVTRQLEIYVSNADSKRIVAMRDSARSLSETDFDQESFDRAVKLFGAALKEVIQFQSPELPQAKMVDGFRIVDRFVSELQNLPTKFDLQLTQVLTASKSHGDLLELLSGESSSQKLAFALTRLSLSVHPDRNQVYGALVFVREDWRTAIRSGEGPSTAKQFCYLHHSYNRVSCAPTDALTALENALPRRAKDLSTVRLHRVVAPASEFTLGCDSEGMQFLDNASLLLHPIWYGATYIGDIAVLLRRKSVLPDYRIIELHHFAEVAGVCFDRLSRVEDIHLTS